MNWLDRNMETLLQQAPAATVRFVSHNRDNSNNNDSLSNSASTNEINAATAVAPQHDTRQFLDATSKPITAYVKNESSSSKPFDQQSVPVVASSSKQNAPVASSSKQSVSKPKYTKNELEAADKKRKFEFKQLETRFCDSFKIAR